MVYVYIYIFSDQYICKKLNISDTQIEWGRTGVAGRWGLGNREVKLVLLGFLNDRSGS